MASTLGLFADGSLEAPVKASWYTPSTNDTDNHLQGTIGFSVTESFFKDGRPAGFQYGSDGYSVVELCVLKSPF